MDITPGQTAPDFTLLGTTGEWSLSAHRGRPVILYFYPKDGTPGCTSQACDVRDNWAEFDRLGAVVVGISPDPLETHAAFAGEHRLPQVLLSDEDHRVLETYGVWREKVKDGRTVMGVARSSVVVGPQGEVLAVLDPVEPQDQSRAALHALMSAT